MDYLTRIRARARGEERGVPGFLHDKTRATQFVEMIGGPTLKTLRTFEKPTEFNFDGLPETFVLKPTFSSSSLGVMVLERRENSKFHDHLRNRALETNAIQTEQIGLAERHPKSKHQWIVEEKVKDAEGHFVPDDYKFYCFQGDIGLIHRTIRRSPLNQHAYYDGDFVPLHDPDGTVIWTHDGILDRVQVAPPENWEQMLNVARRISVAVPSPFVRVDMYNTPSGPVFGEFTLVPGTFFYEDREKMSLPLSTQLGRLWEQAEKKLRR